MEKHLESIDSTSVTASSVIYTGWDCVLCSHSRWEIRGTIIAYTIKKAGLMARLTLCRSSLPVNHFHIIDIIFTCAHGKVHQSQFGKKLFEADLFFELPNRELICILCP
jgi:hypothetical protein